MVTVGPPSEEERAAATKRINLSRAFVGKSIPHFGGHWKEGRKVDTRELDGVAWFFFGEISDADADELLQAVNSGVALNRYITGVASTSLLNRCPVCKQDIKLETNGVEIRVVGDPCPGRRRP